MGLLDFFVIDTGHSGHYTKSIARNTGHGEKNAYSDQEPFHGYCFTCAKR